MPGSVIRTPRSMDLELTSRCNASCSYCYYLNNPDVAYHDLPTASWLSIIEELARCKIMNVCMQGGEPLLRQDFLTLVDAVVANRMRFSVLTNGSLMSAEIAGHLKATRRCNLIQISLDGSTAAVHEQLRGKGTFAKALAAIKTLQDAELPVTVRVTVHPGNIADLKDVTSLLLDDLQLPRFSTNASTMLGSAEKYNEETLLTPRDRLKAMRILAALAEAYPGRIEASAGPLADWQMFHAMEKARRRGQPLAGRGKLVGCGCIFDRLAVRADGALVPCVMLPQMVLGRLGEDRLDEVWQHAPDLQKMRSRCSTLLSAFAQCHDCPWWESCTGNCPGTIYALTGDVNRPCPHACLRRFQNELVEIGESLWA